MLEKVQNYIEEYDLLRTGDGVIAALSGGADSVCLLSVLGKLSASGRWKIRALHVNHGLRGEEADRDERFVKELCSRWEVPLTVVHYDVAGYAKEHRISTEEAGRMLRYEALEEAACRWEKELCESCGGAVRPRVRIGIAHHGDDQAETILHHLMRGSGLRGLAGIHPVQGRRIRPLLCVRRDEIRSWLKSQGESWCEDSTNQENDYTRNRIRNHILPVMTEEINARAVENILHAGELFLKADDYLTAEAENILGTAGKRDLRKHEAGIRVDRFLEQPEIIRSYIVRLMLDAAAPGQKDLTAKHFSAVLDLAESRVGAVCDLPGELAAERTYGELRVYRKTAGALPEVSGKEEDAAPSGELCLKLPEIFEEGWRFEAGDLIFRLFPYENGREIPKNQYTKWFDYDRIKGALSVRTRQNGDFITLSGGGKKTVNRYMIDEKIPKDRRGGIRLLADGSHILWITGYRISEYYKITAHTRYVLQVEKNGGKSHV